MSKSKTLVIREDSNGRKYPVYVESSTPEARIAILEQQLTSERETNEINRRAIAHWKQRAESAEQRIAELEAKK